MCCYLFFRVPQVCYLSIIGTTVCNPGFSDLFVLGSVRSGVAISSECGPLFVLLLNVLFSVYSRRAAEVWNCEIPKKAFARMSFVVSVIIRTTYKTVCATSSQSNHREHRPGRTPEATAEKSRSRPRGTIHKSGIASRFAASVKRPTRHWFVVPLAN